MLEDLIFALSLLVSSWSIYNSFLGFVGLFWRPYEEKEYSGVSFTLVIPARNEEKVLGRLLDRLVNQEYDKSKYEILVIEDGSTDNTLGVCNSYASKYTNISCIHLDKANVINGKSRALNYASKIAKGEIIGVFDADTIPRLDTLAIAAAKFKDKNVAAIQGRLIPINVRESVIARFAALEELVFEYIISGRSKLGFFTPLEGTCSFIRKDVIMELGGFDENILTEDLDFSLKLVSKNYKLVYTPAIVGWREVPVKLRVFILQRLRWYRGHLEISIRENLKRLKKISPRIIDGVFIALTPVFVVLSAINYSLALFYSHNMLYIITTFLVASASFLTFIFTVIISRRHLIEFIYPILSVLYMNFLVALNFIAIMLEVLRFPRVWIKTERSEKLNTVLGEIR